MTENPKGTKSYGVKSVLFTFSFLEATNVLSFFCASQRQFISIQEEIMFILYICIFLFVCFPHSNTHGCASLLQCYLGDSSLSIPVESLCSSLRLRSSLPREAPDVSNRTSADGFAGCFHSL